MRAVLCPELLGPKGEQFGVSSKGSDGMIIFVTMTRRITTVNFLKTNLLIRNDVPPCTF